MSNNVKVKHEGTQIVLPILDGRPMSYREGRKWLDRAERDAESETDIHVPFKGAGLDGLVAFHKALAERYGWVESVPTPGFFGPNPPMMVGVPVGKDEVLQVPWGGISIPGFDGGHLNASVSREDFILSGSVKRKNKSELDEIIKLTKKILAEDSIYKGKAVEVDFGHLSEKEVNIFDCAPRFIELTGEDNLIFSEGVQNDLDVGMFYPVEHSEACRKAKVPLKRGILLAGPYGTGKTLTANTLARKAVDNGWTFIYVKDVKELSHALRFARRYAPAVIFAEDVDQVVTNPEGLNELQNTLDGVDTKDEEIITVLTTNHVEVLQESAPALLRMGRLDSVIDVTPPDAQAASRLVEYYGRGLLEEGTNLAKVGEALEGKIPAFIRETVERAKIAAIGRTKGEASIAGEVREEDILRAAHAMESHQALCTLKKDAGLPKGFTALGTIVTNNESPLRLQ